MLGKGGGSVRSITVHVSYRANDISDEVISSIITVGYIATELHAKYRGENLVFETSRRTPRRRDLSSSGKGTAVVPRSAGRPRSCVRDAFRRATEIFENRISRPRVHLSSRCRAIRHNTWKSRSTPIQCSSSFFFFSFSSSHSLFPSFQFRNVYMHRRRSPSSLKDTICSLCKAFLCAPRELPRSISHGLKIMSREYTIENWRNEQRVRKPVVSPPVAYHVVIHVLYRIITRNR